MKPWEETWRAGPDYDAVHVSDDDQLDMRYGRDDAMGRCRLAAAAPEMARMLLDLEWAGSEWDYGGSDPCCPCCGERAPQKVHFPAVRVDAYTRTEARDEVLYGKHSDDCKLVAVLRKAGVLK